MLFYRRTFTDTFGGSRDGIKREWEVRLALGNDKLQFGKCKDIFVMNPFELAAIEYTGRSGSDVKQASEEKTWEYVYLEEGSLRMLDEKVVSVRYDRPSGEDKRAMTVNLRFEESRDARAFKDELARRIQYLHRRRGLGPGGRNDGRRQGLTRLGRYITADPDV